MENMVASISSLSCNLPDELNWYNFTDTGSYGVEPKSKYGHIKLLHEVVTENMVTTAMIGIDNGKIMLKNIFIFDAPSIQAASI